MIKSGFKYTTLNVLKTCLKKLSWQQNACESYSVYFTWFLSYSIQLYSSSNSVNSNECILTDGTFWDIC